jgi:hypothetical protein
MMFLRTTPRPFGPVALAVLITLATSAIAVPQALADDTPSAAVQGQSQGQGVAVVAVSDAGGTPRDEAFALARAVYASTMRPRGVDEVRARVLAGDPPPTGASAGMRDLAELRASLKGTDAASRRLLSSIGHDVNAKALLVVSRESAPALAAPAPSADDAGVADPDAGATAPAASGGRVVARLFDVGTGEFDAARYEPEPKSEPGESPWRTTVQSLVVRFPPPTAPLAASPGATSSAPPPAASDEGKSKKPFYYSPWFWGAVGGAVLLGGLVILASSGNSDPGPIHLQMRVPH